MFRHILTTGTPVNTKTEPSLKPPKKCPLAQNMKKNLDPDSVQPQTSTPFRPPSNDPYEPTLSDESIELGLDIDTDPNPQNENGTTFSKT